MDRKIILKVEEFDGKIHSLPGEVSTEMPLNWDAEVLAAVRNAVIEAFGKMGAESPSSLFNQWIWERKGEEMNHLEKGGKG